MEERDVFTTLRWFGLGSPIVPVVQPSQSHMREADWTLPVTPKIRPDVLEGLMSGSKPTISISYAKIRPEDQKFYATELLKKLDGSSVQEKSKALTGLFVIRNEELPAHLMKMAKDSSDMLRQLAVFYLGELRIKYAVATISERLSDKNQEVRAAARVAYRKITGANP